ncbi:MAG: tripartite tricarboxylate transporter permease [Planctomycetota bacterium]|nr:tripartite tricarboxylate transporter permease [Planctomycetota bacterium]MDA1250870.1 tripartite tricarboxylate transporter permease [Planctomycetota bacterium]
MSEAFSTALQNTLSPHVLLVMLVAATYGLFIGAIPGLTATMAVALMVPFTFFLDPVAGIAAIVTMEACCIFAGDIPTTLMRIPGTPSSAAYVDDAYALAKKGLHQKALGVSLVFSVVGGLIGSLVLIAAAPMLAGFASQFSTYEYFWLCVLGLSCAAVVSRGSPVKGLFSLSLGLILACVGLGSAHSLPRLTFGSDKLITGINFVPAMIGLFGVSEVLRNVLSSAPRDELGTTSNRETPTSRNWLSRSVDEVFGGIGTRLRSSVKWILASSGIGAVIGMLPGAGADIAAWVAYAVSKRTAPKENRDEYGQGSLDGIAHATTANNSSLAGAWIPALVLGIPGDSVTAIVIGVLMMKNITPGPGIFEPDNPQLSLVYGIYITFILANLMLIPLGFLAIRAGSLIVKIPREIILPLILVFCMVGAFAIDGSFFDVQVMLVLGLLGFVLERYGFPLGPVVLGIILGPRLEETFVQNLTKSTSLVAFFERPIAGGLGVLVIVLWATPLILWARKRMVR